MLDSIHQYFIYSNPTSNMSRQFVTRMRVRPLAISVTHFTEGTRDSNLKKYCCTQTETKMYIANIAKYHFHKPCNKYIHYPLVTRFTEAERTRDYI